MKRLSKHFERWLDVYLCLAVVAYLMWVAAVIS
ncbi:Uncharacterised protein [Kluyvera cryocrescens]|jgi:hypothetical protein|uniref:Uncharacterized protein n=1 Tax=Kluyvera cryocrescens TaxID=580 RepID=A0A485AXP3_KLUCR|nr:Uncharacterised protein [Kluyvera cryocrescens]